MTRVAILGAGIAGLSSGWLLQQQDIDFIILEKQPYVGGLARSFEWHGFYCDFAAHRFFTRNDETLHQLLKLVPMGRHIRRSQIYLKGHWMRDPLDVIELSSKLSLAERLKVLWSYSTRPKHLADENFEQYVLRRYGKSLYEIFFQPYTEKLFGIPGDQISVLWARQKVRLANPFDNLRESTKTKFQYFYYPVKGGYGAIVNRLYEDIKDRVQLKANVTRMETNPRGISKIYYELNGFEYEQPVDAVISTLPMSVTAKMLGKPLALEFQKVEAVYLWIDKPLVSDHHWVYFMDQNIAINRLVEFKNMSPYETDPDTTVICAEVTQNHPDIVNQVVHDLEKTGMLSPADVLDSLVVKENFAYPVYNLDYEKTLAAAEDIFGQFENLFLVGRAAEFRHREVDDNFESAIETVAKVKKIIPVVQKPVEERILVSETINPLVYAVILTYNHFSDTKECLESLLLSDYSNMKILVVDNGSNDGTPDLVRQQYPQVQVIENLNNLGVPAGYNVGFQYALQDSADYILMLNNDTIISTDMATQLLQVAIEDPDTGIVMPKIMYYDQKDEVWSSGGRNRIFPPAILLTDKTNLSNDQIRLIEYAPSCGLLIHRQAFERVGLFDPGYFFFFDDWDFSERVRAHGLHIWYAPSTRMWHKVSRSVKGSNLSFYWRTFGESIARFYRRHGRPVWLSLASHIGYMVLRDFILKPNLKYLPDFWNGVKEGLQKPLGNYPSFKS
jgi:GT2 family glycosyltransferase/protoporphyrinogen oxidase